ncbi:DUF397 domain-containing protein [Actinacidiphila bryophytorum]|jgi:hypothetical protein|uniref:DUF397 domain-containing protein n=1 Tax=Actinacidiphila bryophytorum TaxID=1436133 RepID=UPI002176C3D5|nr:DUF397 domain-containing protein [Actinacidiphila bryophytorum]UWE12235.1 DUF397 domain-containing protein [Actinacidiphila bryophytorum]
MSTHDLAWFKSSYSSAQGDNCIEVGLSWRKSSYSSGSSGDCVEVATCPEVVHVRDSKDKEGPQLAFTPTEWSAFVAYARAL